MGTEGLLVLKKVIWKDKKWWLKSDMLAIKITKGVPVADNDKCEGMTRERASGVEWKIRRGY